MFTKLFIFECFELALSSGAQRTQTNIYKREREREIDYSAICQLCHFHVTQIVLTFERKITQNSMNHTSIIKQIATIKSRLNKQRFLSLFVFVYFIVY